MITALLLASLAGVSLAAIAGTVFTVRRDGYRRQPTCPQKPRFP
ncbi:hypothetical protein [Microbacterium marinum]